MRLVGLTGGIASGKSTVARFFAALGAPIIDADLLAREVLAPGTPGLAEVAARWPEVVRDGVLDRARLGARVFAHPEERQALNAITHPRIAAESMRRAQELAEKGEVAALYEAALIVENGIDASLDGLVVVSIPAEVQLARLRQREGLSEAEAKQRLAAQAPLEEKLRRATWIIDNSGSLAATEAQAQDVWRRIRAGEKTR